MTNRYRIFTEQNYPYFITCTIVDWLPVLAQPPYRQIVLDSLAYLRIYKQTQVNAFVIMSTHLHAVLWPEEGINLSDVLRDFKRFTSRSISQTASRLGDDELLQQFAAARQKGRAQAVSQYQVWQEGSQPEAIFTEQFARQKIDYIHANPVRAGLVETILDWPYSSARAYYLGEETYPPTDLLMVG